MKSAGKARNNGIFRHIRTSKEIIRNLLNDWIKVKRISEECQGNFFYQREEGVKILVSMETPLYNFFIKKISYRTF